mmetsp:Transcript_28384/g.69150  ORF Transcript_28384/g.69150 Transcript_28384/m.69150 type:complete len:324 (+) Transcript_28384:408-1379(+)
MGSPKRSPHSAISFAASSLLVNRPGRSQPRATRWAPVRVAMSMTSSGLSASASVMASARISLPSASVFPISTVSPALEVSTSDGLNALLEIEFSAIGTRICSLALMPVFISMWLRPRMAAAPPMSFFIGSIAEPGLMFSPPVSKTTPLPTRAILGASSGPQAISTSLGGRSDARPTASIIGKSLVRVSPRTTRILAPCSSASAWASFSSSSGPMRFAGRLMRSLARYIPSTTARATSASVPSESRSVGGVSASPSPAPPFWAFSRVNLYEPRPQAMASMTAISSASLPSDSTIFPLLTILYVPPGSFDGARPRASGSEPSSAP